MEESQRDRTRGILFEQPLEAADEPRPIDIESAGVAEQMNTRWRRINQIGKAAVWIVRRQPRRKDGRADDHAEQDDTGFPHSAIPSRTLGSTAASSKSPMSVPSARKVAPMAAHPATR